MYNLFLIKDFTNHSVPSKYQHWDCLYIEFLNGYIIKSNYLELISVLFASFLNVRFHHHALWTILSLNVYCLFHLIFGNGINWDFSIFFCKFFNPIFSTSTVTLHCCPGIDIKRRIGIAYMTLFVVNTYRFFSQSFLLCFPLIRFSL